MPFKADDLSGQKFGKLTAVSESGRASNGCLIWLTHCDCGNKKHVASHLLRKGQVRSCGCLKTGRKPKHGMHDSSEYKAWGSMRFRCNNPNAKNYHRYGGRGIRVCDEWQESFESFLEHVGRKPGPDYFLDRIDNDGNYEPGNVRWVDAQKSAANRRGHSNTSTPAKGVSKINGTYRALLSHNGKAVIRKRFPTLIEAAEAYNKAAISCYGEHAYLNDIDKLRDELMQ